MNVQPTDEMVIVEIAVLQDLQARVRPFSVFGDDNRAAIGAQIDVLTGRMNTDQVIDRFGENTIHRRFDQYVFEAALEAADWLAGMLTDDLLSPAENWKGLMS